MSPCSILVIDDDPDVRESLKDAIEASGNFAVITAENGKVALSVIEVSATANRSDPVIRGSQGFVRKPLHNLDDLITLIQHHC